MFGILGMLCGIGAWVCSILVGVQAIKRQQMAVGIISIICTIVGLVYGWMKANEWGIRQLMLIFTLLFVLAIVFNGINAATGPGLGHR
jgi:hypothetical protein